VKAIEIIVRQQAEQKSIFSEMTAMHARRARVCYFSELVA